MSASLDWYQAAQAATLAFDQYRVFDLRQRVADVDSLLHGIRTELARCRVSEHNRKRATVPHDDLMEAKLFLENHRTQLELAEKKALERAQ